MALQYILLLISFGMPIALLLAYVFLGKVPAGTTMFLCAAFFGLTLNSIYMGYKAGRIKLPLWRVLSLLNWTLIGLSLFAGIIQSLK